jgi:hypothetical protein
MTRHRWQVAPNSERFLLLTNAGRDLAQPLDVVVNWPALGCLDIGIALRCYSDASGVHQILGTAGCRIEQLA